jgi:ligand-binding sensor domain-containing protein
MKATYLRKVLKVWFVCMALLLSFWCKAQNTYLRGYGFADGLQSLQLYDLLHGKSGHLYVGSNIGLLKYNGIQFEKIPFEKHAASISYLKEDVQGRLWAKDFTNRLFFLEQDTLRELKEIRLLLEDETLVDYALDGSILYLATNRSVIRYQLQDGKHKILFSESTEQQALITSILVTSQYCCVATYAGLTLLDKKTGKLEYQLDNWFNRTELLIKNDDLFFASRGKNSGSAWKFNLKSKSLTQIGSLPNETHSNYLRWWQGDLYWCTNNGLYKHDALQNRFNLEHLPQKRISDVHEDDKGNYWISTLDHGLFQMPLSELKLIFKAENSNEQLLNLCLVNDSTLLSGSNLGGIWKLGPNGQVIFSAKTESNNEIQFLVADTSKNLFYSSEGIHSLSTPSQMVKAYYGNLFTLGPPNEVLFATHYSVFKQEQINSRASSPRLPTSAPQQIGERKARARHLFYSKHTNTYFIAYSDGFYQYEASGAYKKIMDDDGQELLVNHVFEDQEGTLWLSTLNRGVLVLKAGDVKASFTTKKGLSSLNIKKTIVLVDGSFWALSETGLDYFDAKDKKLSQYKNALSLGNVVIYDMVANSSHLFLTTSEGILRMPLTPSLRQFVPQLSIQSATINGSYLVEGKQHLPPNSGVLNIRFNALHFKSEGLVYPQYRVLPEKQSWITLAPGTKEISLLNLSSGENIIELRLLANGLYSNTIRWPLFVHKPLWQRWWFILLVIGFIVVVTVLLSKQLNKRKSLSLKLQQQLASSQLTALKAQMNPHFVYNVLNSIQGLIYADKKTEAIDYLGKFSDLMRLTLNFSDKQWDSLLDEIDAMRLYLDLEAGRFNDEFHYEIEIDEKLQQKHTEVPSMLIQPFLENAIKHGLMHKTGHKQLSISFVEDSARGRIIISIDDNGVGRKQANGIQQKRPKKYASFATKAIDSRVDILNRWLTRPIEVEIIDKINDFQLPAGTLVILRIPLLPQTK